MKSPVIFVSGLLVGVAAGWLGGMQSTPVPDPGASIAQRGGVREAQSSSSPTVASADSGSEGPSLRTPRPEIKKTQVFSGDADSPEMKEMVEKIGEKMKRDQQEKRARQIDERVAALRSRLGLTDEQATKARALLEAEESVDKGIMEMTDGKRGLDIEKLLSGVPDQRKATDEKMADLLNPEQKERFQAFQQEQKENRIEIATNRDMTRLQQSLTLTPEQKDKAYQALGGLAQSEEDAPATGLDPAVLKAKRQSRLDALRPILSPEQMRAYEGLPYQAPGGFDEMGGISIQFQTSESK